MSVISAVRLLQLVVLFRHAPAGVRSLSISGIRRRRVHAGRDPEGDRGGSAVQGRAGQDRLGRGQAVQFAERRGQRSRRAGNGCGQGDGGVQDGARGSGISRSRTAPTWDQTEAGIPAAGNLVLSGADQDALGRIGLGLRQYQGFGQGRAPGGGSRSGAEEDRSGPERQQLDRTAERGLLDGLCRRKPWPKRLPRR